MEEKIISIVNEQAARRGVKATLILALVEALAACEYAIRYEPLYRWTLPQAVRPAECSLDTELMLQRSSIGLMQVKGAWAREQGFADWLTQLTDIETNIDVACARVAELMSRYEKRFGIEGVISAYGIATPRRNPGGEFINQSFVDKVMAAMSRLEETSVPATEESLTEMTAAQLRAIAEKLGLAPDKNAKKADLAASILAAQSETKSSE